MTATQPKCYWSECGNDAFTWAWAHLTHQIATMPGVPKHVAQVAQDAHNTIRLLVTAKHQDSNAPKN